MRVENHLVIRKVSCPFRASSTACSRTGTAAAAPVCFSDPRTRRYCPAPRRLVLNSTRCRSPSPQLPSGSTHTLGIVIRIEHVLVAANNRARAGAGRNLGCSAREKSGGASPADFRAAARKFRRCPFAPASRRCRGLPGDNRRTSFRILPNQNMLVSGASPMVFSGLRWIGRQNVLRLAEIQNRLHSPTWFRPGRMKKFIGADATDAVENRVEAQPVVLVAACPATNR